MKDNLLGCLIGSWFGRVYGDVGVSRFFVRIRDAGKLLNNTGARFSVKTFAVALFANFHRGGEMHHDKPAQRRDHAPHFFPGCVVWSNWSADRYPAVLGD